MTVGESINIELVDSKERSEPVRLLLQDFVCWHYDRHVEDSALINDYFDKGAFEKELQDLPGKYLYPDGALLLGYYDNVPAGCVALRKIDADPCEMKRMFVSTPA